MGRFVISCIISYPEGAGKFSIQNLQEDRGGRYEEVSYGAIA
jgi:hypothetical protein